MNVAASVLLTDLYQLTMLQAYFERRMEETAVFEFFVRKLPPNRNFLMAAGLEQALQFLENLRFTPEELQWLADTKRFRPAFLDYLAALRFTGAVHAMPEGTIFFADEPILRVTAPLPQAQIVESRLINLLHFQTLIASKAARCVLAAPGKVLVDFGMRRAHGAEAGLLASRACYLAGFNATATVLAGQHFGIPISGTMAHSFIQAHADETEAFAHFAWANPDNAVFLLDTYDTEAAADKVVRLAPKLAAQGIRVRGVRLDSGDLAEHARRVRRILDGGGLTEARIFASGNLDEFELQRLAAAGAPIDGFGIGTRLDTSADVPYLDCAYKLEEYAGRPRRKRSEGKSTWPGRKQVHRVFDAQGRMAFDTLTVEGDKAEGQALLVEVMRSGQRLGPPASLAHLRASAAAELARLPEALRALTPAPPYRVKVAPALEALAKQVDAVTGRR
jgi:nicotinate phosphoribosyltransferase